MYLDGISHVCCAFYVLCEIFATFFQLAEHSPYIFWSKSRCQLRMHILPFPSRQKEQVGGQWINFFIVVHPTIMETSEFLDQHRSNNIKISNYQIWIEKCIYSDNAMLLIFPVDILEEYAWWQISLINSKFLFQIEIQ